VRCDNNRNGYAAQKKLLFLSESLGDSAQTNSLLYSANQQSEISIPQSAYPFLYTIFPTRGGRTGIGAPPIIKDSFGGIYSRKAMVPIVWVGGLFVTTDNTS
jgi:hypothetical protein